MLRSTATAIALLTVASLGACSDQPAVTVGSAAAGTLATTVPAPPTGETTYQPYGLNALVHQADALVVATVERVGDARWNAADGRPWTLPSGGDSMHPPLQFRDSTIRVERAVIGNSGVEGEPVAVAPGVDLPASQVDGALEPGDRILALLTSEPEFPLQSGSEAAVRLTSGYAGLWTIHDDRAVSVTDVRSAPFDALVARLETERRLGIDLARDCGTTVDPLATPTPC